MRNSSGADELDDTGEAEHFGGWTTFNVACGVTLGETNRARILVELLNIGDKLYTPATESIPARGLSSVVKIAVDL
jgi:hemoglobin/transferrin/lactoferrin receptor protein